ncbi:MAG: hypothetical protein NC417_10160 [Candidatus Gastranaerophilales bacterium]|nr:hypothetical protein [Candidatus Gastranaerophilales bacterium]
MPLIGFESICSKDAAQIVSRDRGNPQYHRGINSGRVYVSHYKIDGVVIKSGNRCDYLLMNETARIAYLIELKGSDLIKAVKQLEVTEQVLMQQLSGYSLRYRIVANKCRTQEIRSSEYRKYQIRWHKRLMLRTGYIEEEI